MSKNLENWEKKDRNQLETDINWTFFIFSSTSCHRLERKVFEMVKNGQNWRKKIKIDPKSEKILIFANPYEENEKSMIFHKHFHSLKIIWT